MPTRIDLAVDAVRDEISNVVRLIEDDCGRRAAVGIPPAPAPGEAMRPNVPSTTFAYHGVRIMHEMRHLDRILDIIPGVGGASFASTSRVDATCERRAVIDRRRRRRRHHHRRHRRSPTSSFGSSSAYAMARARMKRLWGRCTHGISRVMRAIEARSRGALIDLRRRCALPMIGSSFLGGIVEGGGMTAGMDVTSSSRSSTNESTNMTPTPPSPPPPPNNDDGFSSWIRLPKGTTDRAYSNAMNFIRRRILDERRGRGFPQRRKL